MNQMGMVTLTGLQPSNSFQSVLLGEKLYIYGVDVEFHAVLLQQGTRMELETSM